MTRYEISFRLFHPTKQLDNILEQLKIEPRVLNNINASRQTPKGGKLLGTYSESFATAKLISKDEAAKLGSLDMAIADVMRRLKPRETNLLEFHESGGKSEIYIGIFLEDNYDFSLDAKLTKAISRLGVDLIVNIYK